MAIVGRRLSASMKGSCASLHRWARRFSAANYGSSVCSIPRKITVAWPEFNVPVTVPPPEASARMPVPPTTSHVPETCVAPPEKHRST